MIRPAAAFALVLSALATQTAVAQPAAHQDEPGVESRSLMVRYADLDMSRPQGARVLYARIRQAANLVCGGAPSSYMEMGAYADYWRCRDEAVAEAVKTLDQPLLTAMLKGRPETLASR